MKQKKQNESLQKVPGKNSIKQAISVATVVVSLGTSLGVNVTDLFAAEQNSPVRNEAAQHKNAVSWDWGNMNASQMKLSDQLKMIEVSQFKFWNQIKGESRQGKVEVRQYKELQTNEWKLADQIKLLRADESKLSNQAKFWRSNPQKGGQADQIKMDDWTKRELTIANQIKVLEVNEIKISEQLKSLQANQGKF